MTTIRVDPHGVRLAVDAGDNASHALRETSMWLAGHGLSAGPVGLLSGHGLSAATLVARMEALAALAGHEGGLFADAAMHVADAAARLISSQVFSPTRMHDWGDLAHDVRDGSWALARVGRYLRDGTLRQHAARWELGGKLDYRLTNVFGAALLLAGAQFDKRNVYGHLLDESGQLAVGVSEAVHRLPRLEELGAKGAVAALRKGLPTVSKEFESASKLAKVGGVLGVAFAAYDTYHLATDELHDMLHGDERGHSTGQRVTLYAGKVAETAGSLALSIAPFTGPAAPVVFAAGGALLAGGALARGAVFASDWAHDHQADINATTAAVSHTASSAWKAVAHPKLPHAAWSL